jgi:type IV pilus assembly protein PilF
LTISSCVSRSLAARPLAAAVLAVLLGVVMTGCAHAPAPTHDLETASDQTSAEQRARTRLELASGYFSRGQTATALDEVKQALVFNPNYVDAYNLRGLIYASMDEQRLAEESFRRALEINPHDGDTMHNYGWFLCQQKRFGEAQTQFEQAMAQPQYREQIRTLMAEGVCQARDGKWDLAEHSLMRAYELGPSSPTVAANLADVLYHRGQYERARFYIGRVNAVPQQRNAQTLWLAARIENKLNNAVAVRDLGNQLRERFPQSPETLAFDRGRFDE